MATAVSRRTTPPSRGSPRTRVLVVFESGAAGARALHFGRELAEREHAILTVVGVAPQVSVGPRCGCSPDAYNCAVRDAVAQELREAQARLGDVGSRSRFELLVEGKDLSLHDWSVLGGFDVAVLPAHRRPLRRPGHPAANALRRVGVEVAIIDRRGRSLPSV